ncbi:hypothetical protein [Paracoccus aestuariivivens]|uniref:Uncharacterized protein n=1 Tax=Paracoccus aestuariivivens TaxID=1820333 RepID=A0A6L6JGD1_9RHOB|nr:hypothetical protein [Paracoccus aestuariivivens]MTH79184.1 hypothetical protein [Paracoccus aestuariivivens]
MPLNVTTQAFFGSEVAQIRAFDVTHSGFGLLIHVVSSLFWAVIATLLFRGIGHAWIVGLGNALLALVIDYGVPPERMSPGWHRTIPFAGLVAGSIGLGIGLGLGLSLAVRPASALPVKPEIPSPVESDKPHGDPANLMTEDPNRRSHGPTPPHKVTSGADRSGFREQFRFLQVRNPMLHCVWRRG